jgi:hypothetical protein
MRATLLPLALATALVLPASAGAADAVSKDAPNLAWEGGPGSGTSVGTPLGGIGTGFFGCGAPVPNFYDCEDTLFEVKDAGTLKVAIDADDDESDLDLYLYRSDSAGKFDADADEVASQADESADESVTVKNIKPGFYVAHVEFYNALQVTYAGTAVLSDFAAPAPPPAPVTVTPTTQTTPPPATSSAPPAQPAQPAAKKPSKKAACVKKAKKIKKAKARKKALKRCKKLKA